MAMFLSYTADASQAPSPSLGTKSITQNGTYNASDDGYDGYSSVSINVSSSGGNATVIDCGQITVTSESGTDVNIQNYTDQWATLSANTNFLLVYDQLNSGDGYNVAEYLYIPEFDFTSYVTQEKQIHPLLYTRKNYNHSTGILNIQTTEILGLQTTSGVQQVKVFMSPVHLYIYIPNSNS